MAEKTGPTRKLRISGIEDAGDKTSPEIKESKFLKIEKTGSYLVSAARAGEADAPLHDFDPNEVVFIELEDGTRLITTSERLCDEILQLKGKRAADETLDLPASLPLQGPSRGIIGAFAIKTLKFFHIDVPEMAARGIAKFWENHTLGKAEEGRGPGLYRCSTGNSFSLTGLDDKPTPIPADRPILLFLHGTASSTGGSFGQLWDAEKDKRGEKEAKKALREKLFTPYQDNVFGFEHRSLSESPVDNAIALVEQLPVGARLHLISHSRGGLVGELLCRAQLTEARAPFDKWDFNLFKPNDKEENRGDLKKLNSLLKEKRIQVERFVRVACPALGTTLASERFDIYLSVTFGFLEKIPFLNAGPGNLAYDIFTELIMAIAKQRSDPDVLPGIEAMIPNSPLIRILNRSDRVVEGELRVIAGGLLGAEVISGLKTLLTAPLYQDDHDLVVNTLAMFGGAERKAGSAFQFYEGADVCHFNYFKNSDSAKDLVDSITRAAKKKDGFSFYRVHKTDAEKPPYRRDEGQPKPVVFLLPGIMGSHLEVGNDRIWLDFGDLTFGGLEKLKIENQGVRPESPIWIAYGELTKFLANSHEVVPFTYDWRLSIEAEAQRLTEAIEHKLDEVEKHHQPVSILAHSMGGLVARAMIASQAGAKVWERMCRHSKARLIMLGTPNGGSYNIPMLLTGQDAFIKKLALLDLKNQKKDLLEIVSEYPGLIEMMPTHRSLDLFSAAGWEEIQAGDEECDSWQMPAEEILSAAKKVRDNIANDEKTVDPKRMLYVAGHAQATPVDLIFREDKKGKKELGFLATSQGDGRVPWSTGMLPGVKTWYMDAVHGDLADHSDSFDAILELLNKGTTDRLPMTPPESRGVPDLFEMPAERTPLFPDLEDLARSAIGSKKSLHKEKTLHRVQVSVVHGNLGYARNPIMVGHYEGDTIVSAEAHLDRVLDGRLRDLQSLGLYPGKKNTAEVFLNPGKKPAGAVVIGLGAVGSLSPGRLMQAVSCAARSFAKTHWEQKNQAEAAPGNQKSAQLSCLLIGTGAGGIGVSDAVTAILRGVAHANQNLGETNYADRVLIDKIEFIELYQDRAIQAAQVLAQASKDMDIARSFNIDPNLQIERLRGGRKRASFAEEPPWWQRLEIVENQQEQLKFNLLTDRARAEVQLQLTQRQLVDLFIDDAIRTTSSDENISITLFEMLIPNELKEYAPDRRDMVLVLNDGSARYPWELIQERPIENRLAAKWAPEPLAIQAGMVRQLQTSEYRERVVLATDKTALVVGDPPSNFPALSGAEHEARETVQILKDRGYQVTPLIKKNARDILKEIYLRDYRILHLAGHGVYDYDPKDSPQKKTTCDSCGSETRGKGISGMVIGENQFLTPALIRQMRVVPELVFINCCHLGKIKSEDLPPNHPPRLAANLAKELINMGVRAVVAAGWAVDDRAAQRFAKTFYSEMLAGRAFGTAVFQARKETYADHPQVNTWGAYQCYGDPAFSLLRKDEGRQAGQAEAHFTAPAEVIVELENIAEDATTASNSRIASLREWLEAISISLSEKWLENGEIRAALGRAYGELDLFAVAVTHYEALLGSEKANFSVQAVEQLCNLQIRWAVETANDNSQKAIALIDKAEEKLELLDQALKPTAERHSMLGSAAKRRAMIAVDLSPKKKALRRMADKYRAAYELKRKKGEFDSYPLLNWLTADVLLGLLGSRSQKPSDFKVLLEKAAESAAASYRGYPDFWSAITAIDCRLLERLEKRDLAQHQEKLIGDYLDVKKRDGSPREFRSVIEHLDFLKNIVAAAPTKAIREGLGGALLEIRRGLKG